MKDAARTEIDARLLHLETLRAPPLREALGLGPRPEHQLARRIEDALDDQTRFIGELVETLRPTFAHSGERAGGLRRRLRDDGAQRELRPAAVVLEGDGVEHFQRAVEGPRREDDSLRRGDFVELSGHPLDGTVLSAPADSNRAAGPRV